MNSTIRALLSVAIAALITLPCAASSASKEDIVVVYDASGSMWGQIDGVSKVEIARDVMADLANAWSDDINLGLVVYGHRRAGDCSDIETLITPGPLDKAGFIKTVNAIQPKGKTPISASVQHAADLLSYRDHPATVILISDGVETCMADPCALSEELAKQGVKFTAHVVGFDLEDEAHQSLACIAENTGGVFVPAQNARELKDALTRVRTAVETKDKQETAASPAERTDEPEAVSDSTPEVDISAPEQVTTGESFPVRWSSSVHRDDYLTIVPTGAAEKDYASYINARDKNEGELRAPAEPGLYEVRYVLHEGRRVLASTPVEVIEAEVGVSAPEQVTTGASFPVRWSSSVHRDDYLTIVPTGAAEKDYASYINARDKSEGELRAPAEPGLYEVRYVLHEGRRVLASTPVEVVEAQVDVTAPDVVRAAQPIAIQWTATVHRDDYLTLVPLGAPDKDYGPYFSAGSKLEGVLQAPDAVGMYEVRYVLNQGKRVLATHTIEVVDADAPLDDGAGLDVPANATPGETIAVSWSIAAAEGDRRLTLARADQADFTWIVAHPVGNQNSMELQLPDAPGRYEVRFLDIKAKEVLGRAVVTVQ